MSTVFEYDKRTRMENIRDFLMALVIKIPVYLSNTPTNAYIYIYIYI